MAQYMDSDALIKSIKRRAMIPENQSTFLDTDFLDMANEEIMMGIVPVILQHHEDYLLYSEDVSMTVNKRRYEIPYRSVGNKLRDLAWIDAGGNIHEMVRIPIDHVSDYQYNNSTTSNSYVYYVENNEIVLLENPSSSGYTGQLRFTYYLRPNNMVLPSRVGVITNISIGATETVITLDKFPNNFSATADYDIIKKRSPYKSLSINIFPTSVNSSVKAITFNNADLSNNLTVGDHVALAEETIIPQIPGDLHVMLAHRVAARCLEALGDTQGLQAANAKLLEMEQKTGNLIDNRVEASPKKVVNRHSILRGGISKRQYRGE